MAMDSNVLLRDSNDRELVRRAGRQQAAPVRACVATAEGLAGRQLDDRLDGRHLAPQFAYDRRRWRCLADRSM
jgi:hypothetical protein